MTEMQRLFYEWLNMHDESWMAVLYLSLWRTPEERQWPGDE